MNPHLNENYITYNNSFQESEKLTEEEIVHVVNLNYSFKNITKNDNDEEEIDLNIKSISPIKKSTEKVFLNHLLNFLIVYN